MVIVAVVVRSSEYVNQMCSKNWDTFATQNYFDRNGVFMMIMVCAPLLLYSFVFLVCCLREASALLIEVKTKQLKKQMIQRSKDSAKKNDESTSNSKRRTQTKKDD
jgi:transmembrane protein 18